MLKINSEITIDTNTCSFATGIFKKDYKNNHLVIYHYFLKNGLN